MTPRKVLGDSEIDTRPRALSVAGAIAYSGLSEDRVRELHRHGVITGKREGKKILIWRTSIDRYLDSLPEEWVKS